MTPGLLLASAASGAFYVLAPGPAFLALLGIGAGSGRRAGALFLAGHLVGDVVWASLSLIAIIGARSFGTLVFDILGLVCGAYLCVLGWRAVTVRHGADGALNVQPARPALRGLMFGLSNPKAYPVSVAMFTALLASHADSIGWNAFPPLLCSAFVGFVLADTLLVLIIGSAVVRRLYRRHALWVTRVSGVLFLGFGLQAIVASAPALIRLRD